MCGGRTETGKQIDLNTICGGNVDHNKRDKTGMPDAAIVAKMVKKAQSLPLADGHKGIAFTVARCAVDSNGGIATSDQSKQFIYMYDRRGSGVCVEDSVLPKEYKNNPIGPVLVHQSVAPCKRCRAGYKEWARQRVSTIVVSADENYDNCGANKVFIFTPTGLVFFG